jgi:hypothetical protein
MIEKIVKNDTALNIQKVFRGHKSKKDTEKKINALENQSNYVENILKQVSEKQIQNIEKIGSTLVVNVIKKSLGKITQVNEEIKPVELFGGTRSGAAIHPEPTAPPQPLFGKNLKVTMKNNYDEIKKLFDIEPKSYQDVLDAKKKINTYKQNINRIKIRKNAKSILSDEEIALKKDILDEIKKMQKTYDKVYRDYYKTQQPKRGRPGKAKA